MIYHLKVLMSEIYYDILLLTIGKSEKEEF